MKLEHLLLATAAVLGVHASARADRAEAQWSAGGVFGVTRLREEGAAHAEPGLLSGVSMALHYGLSNRLDLGGELLVLVSSNPTFDNTLVFTDPGTPVMGGLTRRTGSALLLLGPTWRYGVAWVPVLSIGAGGGLRYRSNGTFPSLQYFPEEKRATLSLDLAGTAKVGLEHRVGKSLTLGAYASALVAWSPSAPVLPAAAISFGVSYVHYPLRAP